MSSPPCWRLHIIHHAIKPYERNHYGLCGSGHRWRSSLVRQTVHRQQRVRWLGKSADHPSLRSWFGLPCVCPPYMHNTIHFYAYLTDKEQWEPVIYDLFQADAMNAVSVIKEAWAVDCQDHGESASLNEDVLLGASRCVCRHSNIICTAYCSDRYSSLL